jgi:hypothetical protein
MFDTLDTGISSRTEGRAQNLLAGPVIEVSDVTEAMVYLCGPSGRDVTGVALPSTPD